MKKILYAAAALCVIAALHFIYQSFATDSYAESIEVMPYAVQSLAFAILFLLVAVCPSLETIRMWRCLKALPLLLLPALGTAQTYDPGADTISIYDGDHLAFRITPLNVWAVMDDTVLLDCGYWHTGNINRINDATILSFTGENYSGYVVVEYAEATIFLGAIIVFPDWGITAQYGCEPILTLYKTWAADNVHEDLYAAAQLRWQSLKVEACSKRNPLCTCAHKYEFDDPPVPMPARH